MIDKKEENTNITLKAKRIFDNITFNLSHMFKNKREEKGYSHRELSRLANVSTAVISDLETGKIQPKIDTLIKLALVLDINLTDLLSEMNVEKHQVHEPKNDSSIENYLMDFGLDYQGITEVKNYIDYLKWKKYNK